LDGGIKNGVGVGLHWGDSIGERKERSNYENREEIMGDITSDIGLYNMSYGDSHSTTTLIGI